MKDAFDIYKWRRDVLLKEEQNPEPEKETVFILLDTLQDEESVFTGISKTKEGIEALKQSVIELHNIQDPVEISMLKVYEVPFDEYFQVRKETDDMGNLAFK